MLVWQDTSLTLILSLDVVGPDGRLHIHCAGRLRFHEDMELRLMFRCHDSGKCIWTREVLGVLCTTQHENPSSDKRWLSFRVVQNPRPL